MISNSLDIPYLSIKSDANLDLCVKSKDKFELNLHPPINKLLDAIIDFVTYYKWEFVTVLYQDPIRVERFIRFSENHRAQERKLRFQFKILSKNASEWINVMEEIQASGSVHLIIDIRTKLINKFIEIVNLGNENE